MKSRLVRVFISSTFRDFIQERDELVKKVFPELRRRCKERCVELLEVDLRWGITEEQSKSGETLRVCLGEIDRCRPSAPVFFVGLLGERYGWVPPKSYFKQDVLEDPNLGWVKEHIDGKSVTELEVLHGVLRNEAMREKAFFYFRKVGYQDNNWSEIQKYHAAMRPPVEVRREDFTNDGSERGKEVDDEKQRKLKQAVRDASLKWEPRDYEVPGQMAAMVLEDLWKAIDQAFPEEKVPGDTERRRLEHEAFGQSRVAGYIPRPALFAKLDQWLTAPSSTVCVVTGESGSGKSALLAAWMAQLGKNAPKHCFIHYIGGTPESSTARSIVFRLLHEIREWGAVTDPVPDDFSEAVAVLPEWLRRVGEGNWGAVLLVLDALNQLENEDELGLGWLPKELPPGVRLLVSTLPGKAADELRQRKWMTALVEVPALEPAERRSIIEHFLREAGKNPDAIPVDKLANAPQSANALYLRVVLNELKLRASFGKVEELLDDLLEAKDASELFVRVLKNLEEFDRERPDIVRESLGYLGLARRGLTEGELLELLSAEPAPRSGPMPRHYWSPLYLALADSLVSRNGQLGFFHDYLKKAVESEYLDEDWERKKVHGRLGEVALAWNTDKFGSSLKDYALQYGAWHVRRTGDHEALWSLLSDEGYLTEQVERSGHATYVLAGLGEGVEAYASNAPELNEGDDRLAWLAARRAKSQEESQSELVVKALAEFAESSLEESGRAERVLQRLQGLSPNDFHRACQILIIMESLRSSSRGMRVPDRLLETIVAAAEERVPKASGVGYLPAFAEHFHEARPDILFRFAALSSHSLIYRCAELSLLKGDYLTAVSLRTDFLPRAVRELLSNGDSDKAWQVAEIAISQAPAGSTRWLLEALNEIARKDKGTRTCAVLQTYLKRLTPAASIHYALLGEIYSGSDDSASNAAFEESLRLARETADHEQRLSAVVQVCRSLIRSRQLDRAVAEFDQEIEVYAVKATPGTDACTFIRGESQELAHVFAHCNSMPQMERWMKLLVASVFCPELANSNGLFIGCFGEAIGDLMKNIYSAGGPEHRQWTPEVVDLFFNERPPLDDGEIGSMASWSLSLVATSLSLAGNETKAREFHKLACIEGEDVFRRTGEQWLQNSAEMAARSGLASEATAYLEAFKRQSLVRGKDPSWAVGINAEALCESGLCGEAASLLQSISEKNTEHTWKMLASLVKQSRFSEAQFHLTLLADPSAGIHRDHYTAAVVEAAKARQWKIVDDTWSKTSELRYLAGSFLEAWNSLGKDRDAQIDLCRLYKTHAARGKREPHDIDALLLHAFAASSAGDEASALALLLEACGELFSSASGIDSRYEKTPTWFVRAFAGEEAVRHEAARERAAELAKGWFAESLHCEVLIHLIEAVAEGGNYPLAWALQRDISEQNSWLRAFDRLCHAAKAAAEHVKQAYAKRSIATYKSRKGWELLPLCRSLLNADLGALAEPILREIPEVGPLAAGECSQVSAALAKAGNLGAARLLLDSVRSSLEQEAFPEKQGLIDACSFVKCALEIGEEDSASKVLDKALDVAFSQEHSIDRQRRLSSLVEIVPSFPTKKLRRRLLAKCVRLGRQIRYMRSEGQILSDVIFACSECNEFESALRLTAKLQKDATHPEDIPIFKTHIANRMARTGSVQQAMELLDSFEDPLRYPQAWTAVAEQLASLKKFEECKALLERVADFYFGQSESRILTKDFQPIFEFLAATAELEPFGEFIEKLTSYPFADGRLWGALGALLSKKTVNDQLRRSVVKRFAGGALAEVATVENPHRTDGWSSRAQRNHHAFVQLANFAVLHMEPDFEWVMHLKAKASHIESGDLRLGAIDFKGHLPWIRAFFGACSPHSGITKMQIIALIGAHGARGDIVTLCSIARGLPQSDIWGSLQTAAVNMCVDACSIAESLEDNDNFEEAQKARMSALETAAILLGSGHKSVAKLAESIVWPDEDAKLSYYRQAVASSASIYGKIDPNFCRLANKLGILFYERGACVEALPLFVASHEGYLRALGGDADETLSSLLNCGLARRKLGQLNQCIEDLRAVVDGRRRLLGDSDRRTLRALDEISEAYMEQSDWESAMEALSIALQAETPPKHAEDSTQWRKQIAYDETRARRLLRLGEAQFANKIFTDAKASVEESISLYSSLMSNARVRGDRKEKCFALGLRAKNLLAEVFAGLGDFGNAVRIQEAVVKALKDSKGDNDSQTCEAQLDLSALAFRAGDYPTCERVLRYLIGRTTDEPSDTHAMALRGLAQCLVKQQSPKEALALIRTRSEKSDFLFKALRPTLVRLECLAGDPETARSLASEVMGFDPSNAPKIKSRWLADGDFSVIHTFLENLET